MSFLAPLYALGALAIAMPIVFHLIQRRPRGQQLFSSLMFLSPSTPRITRRSRLNHLLLLALRACAVMLLALAFARPFLRTLQQWAAPGPERRVAILLDRSASMRRDSLWQQAQSQVEQILAGLGPRDQAALFSFDDQLHADVPFNNAEGSQRATNDSLIRGALAQLHPGWGATDLGKALTETAERLRVDDATQPTIDSVIVLITDLQQGSRLDTLQTNSWPPDVRLDVRRVQTSAGNASMHCLPPEDGVDPSLVRVRVTNDELSTRESLQLVWQSDDAGQQAMQPKSLHLPPGRSRVITLPRPGSARRLVLQGDAHSFDNVAYLAALQPVEKRLLFVGDDRDERDRQFYFLKRTQLGSLQHPVRIQAHADAAVPEGLDPLETPLIIVARPLSDDWVAPLHRYLTNGGRLLIVLDPADYAAGDGPPDTRTLAKLLELDSLQADLVQSDSFAMLTQLDFRNPVFQPFTDAKFNDFTKIRFWRYYRLATNHEQPWSVLARYDDQAVALVEKTHGHGRLWVMTTGWSPDTSQLALSTKFVPLLVTLLGRSIEPAEHDTGLVVGQPIDLSRRASFQQLICPTGEVVGLQPQQQKFVLTEQVGIYRFVGPSQAWEVAVNLEPAESRTAPLDPAELEQRGIQLGTYETAAELTRRERQLRDTELESRQKIWRWLLVAALSVLAIETYVAGRTSCGPLTVLPED
jgi:hypothetical protein